MKFRVKFRSGYQGKYLGRNGLAKCNAIDIQQVENAGGKFIEIHPVNTKGVRGACSIEIPESDFEEVLDQYLLKLQEHYQGKINAGATGPVMHYLRPTFWERLKNKLKIR